MISFRSLLIASSLLAALTAHGAEVRLSGSSTTAETLIQPRKAAVEALSGHTLMIAASSTGRGLADLAAGRCDAALVSEPLDIAIEAARLAGAQIDPADFVMHPVAQDSVAFVVHPSNPVEQLTGQQLRDIHTGRITNWREVGGPDLPIVVVTNTITGGTPALVRAAVLKGDAFAGSCQQVDSIKLVSARVATLPGAIGATNSSFTTTSEVKVVRTAPLRRPLGFVTRRASSPEIERVITAFRIAANRTSAR